MEPIQEKKDRKGRNTIIIALAVVIVVLALWYVSPKKATPAPFCFDFARNMQFGDRIVLNPVNQGYKVGNMTYFVTEVKALQTALEKEGLFNDTYESTGGGVYYGPFFGPSTQAAVRAFKAKYGLGTGQGNEALGQVDNTMLDKLITLYGCPVVATSTSALSTTTPQK